MTETPADPRDHLSNDQVLMAWDNAKKALENAKEAEMSWRKYAFTRSFPNAKEGTNTTELGNGYELKGVKKLNYKLLDNNIVEKCLDRIAKVGNQGSFIADKLVSWTPSFLITQYRELQEQDTPDAKQILSIVNEMLVIDEGAPTLKIVEPKKARK